MSDLPVSVTSGSMTVVSTSETEEQIRQSMESEPEPEPEPEDEGEPEPEPAAIPRKVSKAAAELGKRGGEASAEARKAAKEAEADDGPDAVAEAERLEKEGKLGKPRHDPKARMLAAIREAKAIREEAETAKRERDAFKAEVEKARASKPAEAPPKPSESKGKPVATDFKTYDEFVEALADWKADERFKAHETKTAQEASVKEYASHIDAQLQKATEAKREYEKTDPGFMKRLSSEVKAIANEPSFARDIQKPLGPEHVISDEIIISGATGPRLLLHFTDHPEELQRIRALRTPQEIQVEMRILAKTLNGAATTATSPRREVSNAPTPIRPVVGAQNVAGDEEPDDDAPLSAHIKRWGQRELRSSR